MSEGEEDAGIRQSRRSLTRTLTTPEISPRHGNEEVSSSRKTSPSRRLRKVDASPSPMTRTKRPKESAFTQQRLPAWQPILTPYSVIPALFVLALLFIPVGILLLIFSNQVQEYSFDYTNCLLQAPAGQFATVPSELGEFQWRRLQSFPKYTSKLDFSSSTMSANNFCEIRFTVDKEITGPVFQYYGLRNYYQNQRLYVKSVDWDQMKGDPISYEGLTNCAPLVGPEDQGDRREKLVYYPCGLIANSMFNDTISAVFKSTDENVSNVYEFPPKGIAWPYDAKKYGPTKYSISQVRPPPFWQYNKELVKDDGTYKELPDLTKDERFQSWMKVAGLPIFRKPYGKHGGSIPPGVYTVLINSVFEVNSYGARKSLIISNTSWIGGKNSFLGYAYIVTGTVFLVLALAFLIRHLISPRRLADTNYLSWSQNNSHARINQD